MDIESETKEVLMKNAIKTVFILATCTDTELERIQQEHPDVVMYLGHLKPIRMFKVWCEKYANENPDTRFTGIDWKEEFIHEIWDDFLMEESRKLKTIDLPNNDIDVDVGPKTIEAPFPDGMSGIPYVKLDIRFYPAFDVKLNSWRSYKQKFKALANMHGFSQIIEKSYNVPTDVNSGEYAIHKSRNGFLQSILEFSLAESTALSRVKRYASTMDRRSAWMKLDKWYEGQGSQETLAKAALEVLATHKLTTTSHGRAELFMEKFETALRDLEDMGKPYDLKMAKINFLNNICDEAYHVVKDTLEMNPDKTYHDAVIEIRRKSISVEGSQSKHARRANRSNRRTRTNDRKTDTRSANRSNKSYQL